MEPPSGQARFGLSLPEQVAAALSEEIVERRLLPGDRLLETALAERFGTSRAPVREALYLLTEEGMVEKTPRRGTAVKHYDEQGVKEIYQARTALEELALERICDVPEKRERTLANLVPLLDEMRDALRAPRRYHDLNLAFHKGIIASSDSELFARLYRQMEGPLKVLLRLSFVDPDVVGSSLADHEAILAAIGQDDAPGASRILRKHNENGMIRALSNLVRPRATREGER